MYRFYLPCLSVTVTTLEKPVPQAKGAIDPAIFFLNPPQTSARDSHVQRRLLCEARRSHALVFETPRDMRDRYQTLDLQNKGSAFITCPDPWAPVNTLGPLHQSALQPRMHRSVALPCGPTVCSLALLDTRVRGHSDGALPHGYRWPHHAAPPGRATWGRVDALP